MDGDHEVMLAPAFGLLVVVLGHQRGHRLRQLSSEGGPVGGRREPHRAVHGERGQLALRPRGAGDQVTDVADELRRQGQQPAGRQAVRRAGRVGRDRRQRGRRDHVRGRGRLQQPLGHVALAALLHQLHQPVVLQRPQVIVDLLPRQADRRGQHGRRPRLGQLSQQACPGRLQGGRRRRRVIDHRYVDHEPSLPSDNFFCQENNSCRRRQRRCDNHVVRCAWM